MMMMMMMCFVSAGSSCSWSSSCLIFSGRDRGSGHSVITQWDVLRIFGILNLMIRVNGHGFYLSAGGRWSSCCRCFGRNFGGLRTRACCFCGGFLVVSIVVVLVMGMRMIGVLVRFLGLSHELVLVMGMGMIRILGLRHELLHRLDMEAPNLAGDARRFRSAAAALQLAAALS